MRDTTRFGRVNEALDKALTRLGIDPTTPNTYLPDRLTGKIGRALGKTESRETWLKRLREQG